MGASDDILVFYIIIIQFNERINAYYICIQIKYPIDFIWKQYR